MSESRVVLPDGRTLTAETEMIEVTTNVPRPDPAWTFTDAAGHVHAYNQGARDYPTMTWVWDEEPTDADPGEGHYECRHCGEHITPGTIGPFPWREFTPGVTTFTLDGQPISEQEYRSLLAEVASR